MPYENLLYEEKNKIGSISLNNPKKGNMLTLKVIIELTDLLNNIGLEKKIKVVVIKGVGENFSIGHDLKEIYNNQPQENLNLFQNCYQMMKAIREIPQPVIAQVHGVASAVGCQLVAACDLAVSSTDALFGTPGIKVGLFCTTPAVFLSRNISRKKAMEFLLTGDFMSAQDALFYGLINKTIPIDELEEKTTDLAKKIAQYSLSTLDIGKKSILSAIEHGRFSSIKLC